MGEKGFWARVKKQADGCWVWTGARTKAGYGRIHKQGYAHRWSWKLANKKDIPEGLNVLHRCDNPPCIRPSHLFLGTKADNNADMAKKGRSTKGDRNPMRMYPELVARGERQGFARLTEKKVLAIRQARIAGATLDSLASKFKVNRITVSDISRGVTWAHVGGERFTGKAKTVEDAELA